jgi:hypothetical protein
VPGRANEIQARVHAQVGLLVTLRLLLLAHIRLVLVVNEVDDRRPRVAVVDIVSKTRRVDNSELDFELLLFELCLDDVHFRKLVELLMMTAIVVLDRG